MGQSKFSDESLLAAGQRTTATISLRGQKNSVKYKSIAAAMRRMNGEYLRRRIQLSSRHCAHLLDPAIFTGPGFDQWSCSGSLAQEMMNERAAAVVSAFETTVQLVENEIYGEGVWTPGSH